MAYSARYCSMTGPLFGYVTGCSIKHFGDGELISTLVLNMNVRPPLNNLLVLNSLSISNLLNSTINLIDTNSLFCLNDTIYAIYLVINDKF